MSMAQLWLFAKQYVWIIGIDIFIFGLIIYLISSRIRHNLAKYEFNNRNKGGVVEFESYKAAKWHHTLQSWTYGLHATGAVTMAFAAIFVVLVKSASQLCIATPSNPCM